MTTTVCTAPTVQSASTWATTSSTSTSGGSTYLKTPYRFAYADLNLKFGSKHLGAYNMYIGLGLRYLSPYNPDMTQKLLFNFTVGFWAF